MIGFNGGLIGKARDTSASSSVPGVWTLAEQLKAKRAGLWASNFVPTQNFMNDGATAAVGGIVPRDGADPFWIDIDPLNADLDYSGTGTFNRCMDGSLSTYVYWTGPDYTAGRVLRIRLELVPRIVPEGDLASLRIYGRTFAGGYESYTARLLDSSKNIISGTSVAINATSDASWHSVPIAGVPYYLELVPGPGAYPRLYLYAIEVNGSILIDT